MNRSKTCRAGASWGTILLISLALLAGCGGPTVESTPAAGAEPAVSPAPSPSATEAAPVSSAPLEEDAPQAEEELHSATGILVEVGMGKLYIETEPGLVVPFSYFEADTSGVTDWSIGARMTVYYTGELVGNDTRSIQVVRVVSAE